MVYLNDDIIAAKIKKAFAYFINGFVKFYKIKKATDEE